MKHLILLITITSLGFAYGQSKKELLVLKDSLLLVVESNQKEIKSLKQDVDDLNIMYNSVRDHVLKYNFNPKDFDIIMDSLIENKDEVMTISNEEKDSLINATETLTSQRDSANAKVDYFVNLRQAQLISDEDIIELKKLKNLLDEDILKQDEFDRRRRIILGEKKTDKTVQKKPVKKEEKKPIEKVENAEKKVEKKPEEKVEKKD